MTKQRDYLTRLEFILVKVHSIHQIINRTDKNMCWILFILVFWLCSYPSLTEYLTSAWYNEGNAKISMYFKNSI